MDSSLDRRRSVPSLGRALRGTLFEEGHFRSQALFHKGDGLVHKRRYALKPQNDVVVDLILRIELIPVDGSQSGQTVFQIIGASVDRGRRIIFPCPVLSVRHSTGMAVTVSVLGSGSRGNATFVKTDGIRILIDAGMSRKEIAKRLEAIGDDPDGVDAVLITHEHNDHSVGLKTLVKDLPIQVFMTWGTITALQGDEHELNGANIVQVLPGVPFKIADTEIMPFSVPHDAAQPVAFSLTCGGVKVSQLTDIGCLPDHVADRLRGSQMLILESNHDLEMLRAGPYPWVLKQRLMGRYGHLSNTAVARFIREQYDGEADHVVLAHLSSKNNHPEIARQEAALALRDRGLSTVRLTITSQDEPMQPIQL